MKESQKKEIHTQEVSEVQKEFDKKKVSLHKREVKLAERERKLEEDVSKAELGFAELNVQSVKELKKEKDAIIAKFKTEVEKQRKEMIREEDALRIKENNCQEREKTLVKKEKDADIGFIEKKKKAIAELKSEHESKLLLSLMNIKNNK